MVYDVCAAVIGDLSVDARVWKEVRSLASSGRSVKLIGCRYDIGEITRRTECRIDVVEVPLGEMSSSPSAGRRILMLSSLWREILRTPARVYHSHNIHVLPACWVAARRHNARLVYDGHELYGEPKPGYGWRRRLVLRLLREIEGFGVSRADAVITTNPSRRLALQARHGVRDIEVIANVPYLVDELKPSSPGYPKDAEILLYQGGIYKERPFEECIRALRLLPGVHFVLVGFGRAQQLTRLKEWALENDVADRVHLLPPVPFEQLVQNAAQATVGIVPLSGSGLNYLLGDTNKLHEYLMAGVPVIASDMPEIRRVVDQGEPAIGELFDSADPSSIAEAYRRVVSDPDVYRRRRAEARRIATERHHWGVEEKRLLGIYDRLGEAAAVTDRGADAVAN